MKQTNPSVAAKLVWIVLFMTSISCGGEIPSPAPTTGSASSGAETPNVAPSDAPTIEERYGSLVTKNEKQGLKEVVFNSAGVQVELMAEEGEVVGDWTYRLSSFGRQGGLLQLQSKVPELVSSKAMFDYVSVKEYYENRAQGVKQSAIIESRPAGVGPIVLEGAVSGYERAEAREGGAVIVFDMGASRYLYYKDLFVEDALGIELDAYMEVADGKIRIVVYDTPETVYPVNVDPTISSSDDAPWWDIDYGSRTVLHVRNSNSSDMPQGYTLSTTWDHAGLVSTSLSLASGNDFRIVYYDKTTETSIELDRICVTSWNTSTTQIYFRAQERILAGDESKSYYAYYNNPSAGSPPKDGVDVYMFYDDFSGGLSSWDTGSAVGSWSTVTNFLDSADVAGTHYFIQQSSVETPTDYVVEFDCYSPFDGSIWNLFITMKENPADPQQRIVVGAREGADQWVVEKWTNSTSNTTLASVSQTVDRGIWYKCKLRYLSGTLTFWVDGAQKFTYTLVAPENGWDDVIGLANANSHAQFDNVKLRYLMSQEPEVVAEEEWSEGVCSFRQRIEVTNPSATKTLPAGYSVRVDIPHQLWVSGGVIGEAGSATVDDTWQTINFGNAYLSPVVIASVPTYNETDETVVRVRNISGSSCQMKLEEVSNRDGVHGNETVGYLVVEEGDWDLDGTIRLQAGTVDTNAAVKAGTGNWTNISFATAFSGTPAVFSTVQTYAEAYPTKTRQRNATTTNFDVSLEEDDGGDTIHLAETIGWVAVTQGTTTNNGSLAEFDRTADAVTHNWYNQTFSQSYGAAPVFIANLSKYDGSDVSGGRIQNLAAGSVDIKCEEDTIADAEINHTGEEFSFFALENAGEITAVNGPAKAQIDGDDVRIVYFNGSAYDEIDRVTSNGWNQASTRLYFKTQASIASSGVDDNYFIYYGNNALGAPPDDPEDVYLWYDDYKSNTIVAGGDAYANGVLYESNITDSFYAVGTDFLSSNTSATMGAGGVLILDMGRGEEIKNAAGTDFMVETETGAGNDFDVYISEWELGPYVYVGAGTAADPTFDISATGIAKARYVKIAQTSGAPEINAIVATNRFASVTSTSYVNGKHVDIAGNNTALVRYDSVRQVATYDTGRNYCGGLRLPSISGTDILVQADVNTFRVYNQNGTFGMLGRWTTQTDNYYAHMSNGQYTSPGIAVGSGAQRNTTVATPGGNSYLPNNTSANGDGNGTSDGMNPQRSTVTTAGGMTGIDTLRYGVYALDANNDAHRFWVNAETDSAATLENLSYANAGYATTGQPAIEAANQWGFLDNFVVRRYFYPEPGAALTGEASSTDFKVMGVHPSTNATYPGATEVQILRIDVEAGSGESATQFIIASQNTTDADVSGVSLYYTGTSTTFSTTSPFGTAGQTFSGGAVTFNDSLSLADDSLVHFFLVYDVAGGAGIGNTLDAKIDVGGVTISATQYPETDPVDPSGGILVANLQTLSAVTVTNIDTSNAKPGGSDLQILRIQFDVTGTGAPLSIEELTLTTTNISDSDVSTVSAYYTGNDQAFNTLMPFGTVNQAISSGQVAFSDIQDLGDGSSADSFYLFITYDMSDVATLGNTVDAKILSNDITVEGSTYPVTTQDPAGNRTIAVPTGTIANLPPVAISVDSDPSLQNFQTFNETDGGDADLYVDNLESDDGTYAGGNMGAIGNVFDPQKASVEFLFDLDDEVAGIEGRDINSLRVEFEMYLTGQNLGTAPASSSADWEEVNYAKVQLYDFVNSTWSTMESDFLQTTAVNWNGGDEALYWDNTTDTNPERPLRRFKSSGFSDSNMNSSGQIKIRTVIEGVFIGTGGRCNFICDYAHVSLNYGANVEMVSYRFADSGQLPLGNENTAYTAGTGEDLHLRAGVRSRYRPFVGQRIGLQYDTDANFTSGDGFNPKVMTTSTTELTMWDDGAHLEGDTISGSNLLSSIDVLGIYHEDEIPPVQNKNQDLVYEEDFTVRGLSTGTYYIRVVKLDGFGALLAPLDVSSNVAILSIATPTINQAAYRFGTNVASPVWDAVDTPKELVVDDIYILAVRMENTGGTGANNNWQLQFQQTSGTPGPWQNVTTVASDWTAVDGVYAADDASVATASFVCGAGTGTAAAGRYSEVGVSQSNTNPFNIPAGNYMEFWYAISPSSIAAGKAYRFRVTNSGSSAGFSYLVSPEAQQVSTEQVSYRVLDENESPTTSESASAQVSTDQLLHLRVGVRSNNGGWSGHRLGIQYDTTSDFSSPTIVTDATSMVTLWDDGDRADESAVVALSLSGSPSAGRYHETNVLSAVEPAMTADQLYEEDYSIYFDTPGTYYVRVVELTAGGAFSAALDDYSKLITFSVTNPSLRQNFFNFAADSTTPSFVGTDVQLEFVPGTKYLLSMQIENRSGVGDAPWWNGSYGKRKQIAITNNNSVDAMPTGYSTYITIDHASLVTGGLSLASGNDVRVVYFTGGGSVELDRACETSWNSSTSTIWFKTQASIGAGLADSNYYVYYDYSSAGAPPANRANVYYFYDDYSGGLGSWTGSSNGTWAVNGSVDAWCDDTNPVDQLYYKALGGSTPANKYVETRSRALSTGESRNMFVITNRDSATGDFIAWGGDDTNNFWRFETWDISTNGRATQQQNPYAIASDTWYTLGVSVEGDEYEIYVDGVLKMQSTYSTSWNPEIGMGAYNADTEFDYFKVRQYLSPEPSTTVGGTDTLANFQLQFQKTSGTPGPWTSITTSSSEWRAQSGVFGVDGRTVNTNEFVCNSGNPPTNAGTIPQAGVYTETGVFTKQITAGNYLELWYCVSPMSEAAGESYKFRVTNSGNSSAYTYTTYAVAAQTQIEQVSFRWLDSGEAPATSENAGYDATVNDELHLRLGVRSNNGAYGTHYLALQYDTDINFTSPTIITTGTSNLRMWDDGDHSEGDEVAASSLSGSPTLAKYHEDSIPPAETKNADTLYEEDFTVKVVGTGQFYVRAVLVDSSGVFVSALDEYTQIISITGNNPSCSQTSYNFGAGELTAGAGFGSANTAIPFSPGTTYTVAIRMENSGAVAVNFDNRLQYQKTNGTPGSWTDVTTTSSAWKAVVNTAQNGAAIATGNFVTNAGAQALINGRYSETGHQPSYSLLATSETELRYEIEATASAIGNAYRFRVTNSGATTGIAYSVYPEVYDITYEQVSFRFAGENESALEAQNTSLQAAVGQLLHLRVGIRSNNAAWNGHKLAVQYDTDNAFTPGDGFNPVVMTIGTTELQMWDDSDRSENSGTTGLILSGSPSAGIYHESHDLINAQNKNAGTLYEEDFTVWPQTTGTYYIRVVDYTTASPVTLDLYTSPVISLTVSVPNVGQAASNWAPDGATPSFGTVDDILEFTTPTKYILAVRVENTGASPSTFNWKLQYQKDPTGTPGAWTNVTTTSNDMRATDGVYASSGDTVNTGSFVTGAGTGSAIDGKYTETGNVSGFTLGAGDYTELWFAVQTQSSSALNRYKFRVTDNGSTSSFTYTVYPECAQQVTAQLAYRWLDGSESTVAAENNVYNAIVGDQLHVRAAIRSRHLDWGTHYFSLQVDDNIGFSSPAMVTTSGADIKYWDDADRTKGDPIAAQILSSVNANGVYHEDSVPPIQSKNADSVYGEDFAVEITSVGNFYLRVVEVDSAGTFVSTLDSYSSTISISGNNPSSLQDSSAFGSGELTAGTGFQAAGTSLSMTIGSNYTLAVRISNTGLVASSFDWRLQYQKVNGTPGAWTDVNSTSAAIKSVAGGTPQDGTAIIVTDFSSGAGTGTEVDGRYSETGHHPGYVLGAGNQTELRYEIQPQTGAKGNKYNFRVTNSGSSTGFVYNVYPVSFNVTHEQVAFVVCDDTEASVANEDTVAYLAVDQNAHLRVGIRSNHSDWSNHKLSLQYDGDGDGDFSTGSPVNITTASSLVMMWDDGDHTGGDSLTSKLISSSSGSVFGIYHEVQNQGFQTKTKDISYEEDFTIKVDTAGTYYLRVVDYNGGTPAALHTYTSPVVQIVVAVPAITQGAYNAGTNVASPVWTGINTKMTFATGSNYIASVRVKNSGATPQNYSWRLQFQEDPQGTPGSWTNVTTTSSHIRAVDGAFGTTGDPVLTGTFVSGATTGTPVDGKYSESGIVTAYTLGADEYTEFWYCIQPQATAALKHYRFRVTNNGNAGPFTYSVYPEIAQKSTELVSYRWLDSAEVALTAQNTALNASTNDKLNLRVGVKSKGLDWGTHYLGLQYDTNVSFPSPILVTTGTANVRYHDDTGHNIGDALGSTVLTGTPTAGKYHEGTASPPALTASAYTLYEHNFTVEVLTANTFYLRVVELNGDGTFNKVLNVYTMKPTVSVYTPSTEQISYNWGAGELTAGTGFGTVDTQLSFLVDNTYTLTMRYENSGGASTAADWQLQYQKTNGVPGAWTNVTTGSGVWKAVANTVQDGTTVTTGNFVTTTGGGTPASGRYSETGKHTSYILGAGDETELRYEIQPDSGAAGNTYRFRLTNAGSTTGFIYNVYAQAAHGSTTWIGTSTDWSDPSNWTNGVPGASDDAIVPDTPSGGNFPLISAANAYARDLTIIAATSPTTISLDPGLTLTVNGTLTVSGTLVNKVIFERVGTTGGFNFTLGASSSVDMEYFEVNGGQLKFGSGTTVFQFRRGRFDNPHTTAKLFLDVSLYTGASFTVGAVNFFNSTYIGGAKNVKAATGTNVIHFFGSKGPLSGETFDNDPSNKIRWFANEPWFRNNNSGLEYPNLQDAINAASDGDEIISRNPIPWDGDIVIPINNLILQGLVIDGNVNTNGVATGVRLVNLFVSGSVGNTGPVKEVLNCSVDGTINADPSTGVVKWTLSSGAINAPTTVENIVDASASTNHWRDVAKFDFHLKPTSTAIDAATTSNVLIDFDAQTRADLDSIPDIGADEVDTADGIGDQVWKRGDNDAVADRFGVVNNKYLDLWGSQLLWLVTGLADNTASKWQNALVAVDTYQGDVVAGIRGAVSTTTSNLGFTNGFMTFPGPVKNVTVLALGGKYQMFVNYDADSDGRAETMRKIVVPYSGALSKTNRPTWASATIEWTFAVTEGPLSWISFQYETGVYDVAVVAGADSGRTGNSNPVVIRINNDPLDVGNYGTIRYSNQRGSAPHYNANVGPMAVSSGGFILALESNVIGDDDIARVDKDLTQLASFDIGINGVAYSILPGTFGTTKLWVTGDQDYFFQADYQAQGATSPFDPFDLSAQSISEGTSSEIVNGPRSMSNTPWLFIGYKEDGSSYIAKVDQSDGSTDNDWIFNATPGLGREELFGSILRGGVWYDRLDGFVWAITDESLIYALSCPNTAAGDGDDGRFRAGYPIRLMNERIKDSALVLSGPDHLVITFLESGNIQAYRVR
ncbi:MAG: hypothetical protein NUW37_01585 [Planctomycetes bacterium]|nr:hypothetical protein [Planctomycetota bacterium]